MKKAIGFGAMLLLMVASVFALTPGFQVSKQAVVTGDWAWIGSSWQPVTQNNVTYDYANGVILTNVR